MFDPELYSISVRKITRDGESAFEASVLEFPHVKAYGNSFSEAYQSAIEFIVGLIEQSQEERRTVPSPRTIENNFSGRVTLRLPKTMHRLAARYAEESCISLNQYVVNAVAYYTGIVERPDTANTWLGLANYRQNIENFATKIYIAGEMSNVGALVATPRAHISLTPKVTGHAEEYSVFPSWPRKNPYIEEESVSVGYHSKDIQ